MKTDHDYYEAYLSCNLKPGEEMKVESKVYISRDNIDISKLTDMPLNQLEATLGDCEFAEQKIYEKAQAVVHEWETAAGKSLLIKQAIEFLKTPTVEHTANKWITDDYGHQHISNAVYKMSHYIYENTSYDRDTKQSVPVAWDLTWRVSTQCPGNRQYNGEKIAGQDRKHFTDKAAMEKYLQGRIKTYSHLFNDVMPKIPKEYVRYFTVNGKLLPGYSVEGAERAAVPKKENDRKPSVLKGLTANKAEIKSSASEKGKKLDKPEL